MAGSHVTGSTSSEVSRLDASTPLCGKSAFMEIHTPGQGQLSQHHSGGTVCGSPSPLGGVANGNGNGNGCGGYGTSPALSTTPYGNVRPSPPAGYHHLHGSLSASQQHQHHQALDGFISSSQVFQQKPDIVYSLAYYLIRSIITHLYITMATEKQRK